MRRRRTIRKSPTAPTVTGRNWTPAQATAFQLRHARPLGASGHAINLGSTIDNLAMLEGAAVPPTDPAWTYVDHYSDAIHLMRHGWPEGVALARHTIARIRRMLPVSVTQPRVSRHGVTPHGGTLIDIPAYIQGRPDHWVNRVKSRQQTIGDSIIRLGVNVCVSNDVSHATMIARAATVYALAEILQAQNKQVEVTCYRAGFGGGNSQHPVVVYWRALQVGQEANPGRLVFAMGHPAMLRRVLFAGLTACPESSWTGYGGSLYPADLAKVAPALARTFDVRIESGPSNSRAGQAMEWQSPEHQTRWILATLRQCGIGAE